MQKERFVITNRVFLLGLDELYREAMKQHEEDELLRSARETAQALSVPPADVPIEGYYAESEPLTEYFRLVRALQQVPKVRESEVADVRGFERLKQVTASPIFGPPSDGRFLLSVGKDALSAALEKTSPDWTVENLTARAYECAAGSTDFSLVTLAALSRDGVVLTALRESVVLYAECFAGGGPPREPEYVWEVDELLEQRASQFVETFNALFDERLPRPAAANAKTYWMASNEWEIVGRCVRIGFDDSVRPVRHYHWPIDYDSQYRTVVTEFWDAEIWTTERYREEQAEKELRRSAPR